MVCKKKHKSCHKNNTDDVVHKVKHKTVHQNTVAKTPKDVLDNLL